MQLSLAQFHTQFSQNKWQPFYLLVGQVPLLLKETRDYIWQHATRHGFKRRQLFFLEPGFDPACLEAAVNNLNLFAEKIGIELCSLAGGIEKKLAEYITTHMDTIKHHCYLLVTLDKVTPTQKKTLWYQVFHQQGAVINIYPPSASTLPAWISQRMRHYGLHANQDSILWLAHLTEGDVSATQQAIEKLSLLYKNTPITPSKINAVIGTHTQFTIFDLTHYLFLGNTQRALQIISELREANIALPLVLWAMSEALRKLYSLLFTYQRGGNLDQLLASEWKTRQQPLKTALQRLDLKRIREGILSAQQIDEWIKRSQTQLAWQELEHLVLQLSSHH